MGKRGPTPKDNVQRRNAENKPTMIEDDPKRIVTVPKLGTYRLEVTEVEGHGARRSVYKSTRTVSYGAHARAVWTELWGSAIAQQYRPEMHEPLWRWIKLVDRFHNLGDHSVAKELLQLEKEFFMTLQSQKRERLMFFSTPATAAAPRPAEGDEPPAVRSHAERRQRVKAVADG